jgi:hypothetical protein
VEQEHRMTDEIRADMGEQMAGLLNGMIINAKRNVWP